MYAQEYQMYYYYNDLKGQLLYKKMKNNRATVYALLRAVVGKNHRF
jgi:hypothetical protein